ncbi:hypothetical protein ASPZODRAFT_127356 [Penicilliopsis zonata CBS 506.65]|uniref:Crh-like protein n=1 Tax=Penicilliopsis zonata CBS 506.65 TaxID=1073090 RepID=A0A1L9SVU1_9EURO|nr:hypothetical protein ASPZODRAFT_127356 [Penicilliopsis zonata CBS 506.65]OJJ51299.1 hypothetical protein ASPZODRAFT_127356 [Penicilliopsis zonata CBS 506.65]
MVRFITALLAVSASLSTVWATTTCSVDSPCPEDSPCCSAYGECGVGAYCLGGCYPLASYSIDSCTPAPVCVNKTYTWDNLDKAASNEVYLGNATEYDWVYSGTPLLDNGNLLLTMPNNSVGTLFSNNHYVWYGRISAKLKTSRGAGVVTAFILMSDVKDEIDLEFVGVDLYHGQTNYYFEGILDYDNEINATVSSNTFENFHEYTIDWTPDAITWYVDGTAARTLNRSATFNATSNRYQFPQTPSRVEMSLWPAGLSTEAEGTIEWAGGLVNWSSTDMEEHGYYYATFGEITVECYNPPSGANIQGDKSYVYTSDSAVTNNTVEITDRNTTLNNFDDTGLNMTAGTTAGASATASSGDSVPTSNGAGTVPGSSDSGSGTDSSSSSTTGFVQGGTTTDKSGATSQNTRIRQGSLFAVVVAVVALVVI